MTAPTFNPYAPASTRNGEQAGSLTPPALAADVVVPLGTATSVAATFADRLRAAARRFDGMHSRPDLEVEHLTAAECEQLADELQRLLPAVPCGCSIDGAPMCAAVGRGPVALGYLCSRPYGHDGDHVACGASHHRFATWGAS